MTMNWKQNLAPSLVVFLISVPLSMGIAIASGVAPASGLVTAIVGGLVIGSLTGSRLQISGPSAGLAVMVLDVVKDHGLAALAIVVVLMGLLQTGAGLLKLGQVFRAVAPAVIDGMLAGIGVLILSSQFHVMVDDAPKGSGLQNLLSIPEAIYKAVGAMDGSAHQWAALIGILTLIVLVGMNQIKRGPLRHVPAPLAAVGIATAAAEFLPVPIQRVTMPNSLFEALGTPGVADLALLASPSILVAGLTLAFVASAETLLCATAVDAMHDGEGTDYDRELMAQGIGNTVCGLLGALPTTGVITRSTANVQAGASSPASAVLVGVWLLIVMLLFPTALEIIPLASLAGLLVYVGFKLIATRPLRELRWYGRSELAIFLVTLGVIVTVNLLTGIVVGLLMAAGKLVYSRGQQFHRLEITVTEDDALKRTHINLRGAASFIRLPRLAAALEALPKDREVHLHIHELDYIDHACLDLLEKWEAERTRARSPVRVEWSKLKHRYHAANVLDSTPEEHADAPQDVRLLDFLRPDSILIDPAFDDKYHAIEVLAHHMARVHPEHDDPERVTASAIQREHEATTCVGAGLMVPHARVDNAFRLSGVMALSSTGWDLGAPDDMPVKCIVLLSTPEREASRHLAVLSAFARLFVAAPELRDRLLGSASPDEAYALLTSIDADSINYHFESAE